MVKKTLLFVLTPTLLLGRIQFVHETPDKTTLQYFLAMKGAYEQLNKKQTVAFHTYEQLEESGAASQALQQAKAQLLFDAGKYQDVINLVPAPTTITHENKELALCLAQAYFFTQDLEKSKLLLTKLKEAIPYDDRIDYYLASLHIKQKNYHLARPIVDAILMQEARESKHFLFYFLNAKSHFLEANYLKALHCIEKSLLLNSRFSKGHLLKGIILEKLNQPLAALEAYKTYVEDSVDPDIDKKIVSLSFDAQNFAQALTYLQKNPIDSVNYFHDIALIYIKLGHIKKAASFVKQALQKDATSTKARSLHLHILLQEKKYAEVLLVCSQWLTDDPYNETFLKTFLQLPSEGVSLSSIQRTLHTVAQKTQSHSHCFALGDLFAHFDKYSTARQWYQQALHDKKLDTQSLRASMLHFQIAFTYYKEDQYPAMMKALTKSRACTVVYPSTYNLLAYTSAKEKTECTSAHELVDKALLACPDSAYYLDTKGYIYLQERNFVSAEKYFLQALTNKPQDTFIKQHLQQTHMLDDKETT